MSDGSEKIQIGDSVKTLDIEKQLIEIKKVILVTSPIHENIVKIEMEDGVANSNTFDHSYYVVVKVGVLIDQNSIESVTA